MAAIEWALLKPTGRLESVDRGIYLRGEDRCRVMLLHGLTGTPSELGYVAHWLRSRARLHVSCPRLANHGQPLGVLARTTWREIYQSARDAFAQARAAARDERVPLVVGGLSMGANLALMLAAEFAADVAGVVCLAPTLFYDGWSVPWYHRLIGFAHFTGLKRYAYFREGEPFGLKDEALRSKIAAQYAAMSLQDSRNAAQTGYAHFPVALFCEMRHLIRKCKQALPRVASPVLVVQAENDDVTSPRNARYILERVAAKRRELLLLKNSYHLVAADLERSLVAERLQQFCDSLAAPDSHRAEVARAA